MKSDIEDDGFITVAPASLPPSIAWPEGRKDDAETGMSHLWHAACCLTFLISYEARKIGEDDRKVLD
jgi:hypothetical protein